MVAADDAASDSGGVISAGEATDVVTGASGFGMLDGTIKAGGIVVSVSFTAFSSTASLQVQQQMQCSGGDKNQILEMNYTHLGTHAGGYCKGLCEKIRSQA
jgi:hypothetical protein